LEIRSPHGRVVDQPLQQFLKRIDACGPCIGVVGIEVVGKATRLTTAATATATAAAATAAAATAATNKAVGSTWIVIITSRIAIVGFGVILGERL
jgi:hypothetical protein